VGTPAVTMAEILEAITAANNLADSGQLMITNGARGRQ
jgi:hypothetical protein